jgi:hypothetical protein
MKKVASVLTLIAGLSFLGVGTVSADMVLTLDADYAYVPEKGANLTDQNILDAINAKLDPDISLGALGLMLYKYEASDEGAGKEEGSLAAAYNVDPVNRLTGFTISYVGGVGGEYIAKPTYLVIKDGEAGALIWNISRWNGTETLTVTASKDGVLQSSFWPDPQNAHEISNIQLWGTSEQGAPPVPEPGTYLAGALLLLPFTSSLLKRVRRAAA